MPNSLGFTRQGLDLALLMKRGYDEGKPLCVPGSEDRLLIPEYLLNRDIDLQELDEPLPLAMVATRDPESSMAVAATVRMSPMASTTDLVTGVYEMLAETSRHTVVKKCVDLVTESAFSPTVIARVRRNATDFIVSTRKQYTDALRSNLRALLGGSLDPRIFVEEFFQLSEAGNLRLDIRKRLVVGLLTAERIRPAVKFLFLENIERLPAPVQTEIISEVISAPPTVGIDAIKLELEWVRKDLAASVH